MILDNQNLPEIVVSRDAGRNNNIGNEDNVNSANFSSIPTEGNPGESSAESVFAPGSSHPTKMAESPKLFRAANKLHHWPLKKPPNHNDGCIPLESSLPGWDDAPGSPHRVPLVTNNNGSPRLSNRIANIYGISRQTNAPSPHSSPRHQAIARIVSPNPEGHRSLIKMFKNDAPLPGSPKFSKKINLADLSSSTENTEKHSSEQGSPKRNIFMNNSPSHSPGYHNPYQQTSFVKSPLLQSNEIKFTYDSPTHKRNESVASHRKLTKAPPSPRHNTISQHKTVSNDDHGMNDNSLNNSNTKSRIPCRISLINVNDCSKDSTLVQNNLSIVKPLVTTNLRETFQKMKQTNLQFDELFNVDTDESQRYNTNVNIQECPKYKILEEKLNCNHNIINGFNNVKNELCDEQESSFELKSDSDHDSLVASNEWNSVNISDHVSNDTVWNSNADSTDQKMSIDEKCSLKRSSVDSLRPRTNSLGSWPHSSSHAKSYSTGGGSLACSLTGTQAISDTDSGMAESVSSKMVLIKCKDGNYLTRLFLNTEGMYEANLNYFQLYTD